MSGLLSNLLGSGGKISKLITNSKGSISALVALLIAIGVISGASLIAVGTTYRDASRLNAGTLHDERLSSNVAKYDDLAPHFLNKVKAASFEGNLKGDLKGNVTGNVTGDVVGHVTGDVTGNADTASSLLFTPTGCAPGQFANSIDSQANLGCSFVGASFTNLNASNITSGTLNDARLSSNVSLKNGNNVFTGVNTFTNTSNSFTGNFVGNASTASAFDHNPADCSAGAFANAIAANGNLSCSTDGSSLQNLNASNITSGTLDDARLSSNVPLLDANQTFTGSNDFTQNVTAPIFVGDLQGNADTATALAADPTDCAAGAFANAIDASGNLSCSTDGSSLTGVDAATLQGNNAAFFQDASNLNAGTLSDARLSSNVAKYDDASPTFTNGVTAPSFTGSLIGNADTATALASDPSDCAAGAFANAIDASGNLSCSTDGSSLTGVDAATLQGNDAAFFQNADNINAGTLSDARLSSNVAKYDDASPTFTNGVTAPSFTGSLIGNADTASALAADPADCAAGSFANAIAANGDLSCSADGSSLTGVDAVTLQGNNAAFFQDASNLNAGTLSDARLSSNVAKYDDATPTFTNNLTAPVFVGDLQGNADTATALAADPTDCAAGSFANAIDDQANLSCSADGSNLTGVDAATLQGDNAAFFQDASNINAGTLGDSFLSTNIAKYNDSTPTFTNNVTAPVFVGGLQGNADTATALAADPTDCAAGSFANAIVATGDLTCTNDGSGLTSVDAATLQGNAASFFQDASNLNAGTLNDARLSSNVAKYADATPNFTNAVTAPSFTGDLSGNAGTASALAADPADCAAGSFANAIAANGDLSCSADGSSLTGVDAATLQGNAASFFQDASNLNAGTLSDARLSSNVALLNGNNTFTGTLTVSGSAVDFSGATSFTVPTTGGADGGACTVAGAIAYNGADFLGCNGATWMKLNN